MAASGHELKKIITVNDFLNEILNLERPSMVLDWIQPRTSQRGITSNVVPARGPGGLFISVFCH